MSDQPRNESRSATRFKRISAVTAAGLLAGLIAAAIGGVASAQTVVESVEPDAPVEHVARTRTFQADNDAADAEGNHFADISAADEAVFERFDQCLADAGVDVEATFELDGAEVDDTVLDAAFDRCDPILDELSDDFTDDFDDLSPADEAVFDEYDQCLEDGGIDTIFEQESIDDAAIDALFENCDLILDGLSAEAQEFFGDCPDDAELEDAAELEGADS